jgi:hypothetical protein
VHHFQERKKSELFDIIAVRRVRHRGGCAVVQELVDEGDRAEDAMDTIGIFA